MSTTTEVLVTNSAAVELPTLVGNNGRIAVEIQNLGPNPIYVAFSQATAVVTKARRIEPSGGIWALDARPGVRLWAIAGTADQVTGAATIVSNLGPT